MELDEPDSQAGDEADDIAYIVQSDDEAGGEAGSRAGLGPGPVVDLATWPSPHLPYRLTVHPIYSTIEGITKFIQDEAEKAGFGAVRKRVNYYGGRGQRQANRVDFQCHCSGIQETTRLLLWIAK
jgi:hypothetical protein